MATVTTLTFGTPTTFTFTTLSSLAASRVTGAAAAALTVSTTTVCDYQLELHIVYSAAVPHGLIYAGICTSTGGTNYGAPYAGSDATIALVQACIPPQGGNPGNFVTGPRNTLYFPGSQIFLAAVYNTEGLATTPTINIEIPSVAAVLGTNNVVAQKWAPFVLNDTTAAFGAGCSATYTALTYTNT